MLTKKTTGLVTAVLRMLMVMVWNCCWGQRRTLSISSTVVQQLGTTHFHFTLELNYLVIRNASKQVLTVCGYSIHVLHVFTSAQLWFRACTWWYIRLRAQRSEGTMMQHWRNVFLGWLQC